jgi:hypothetical protein
LATIKLLLTFTFLFAAAAASGIIPVNAAVDVSPVPGVPRSDGTYHFYYYGSAHWQWPFDEDTYVAVNFDPADNEGDVTGDAYAVTYVDSLWNYDPDDDYEVTLYICNDVEGLPDLENPRYESGPYIPDYYSSWDQHRVPDPVNFNGGAVSWVVFLVPYPYGHPISDGDGNSGHSWISDDGETWELMEEEGGVDWVFGVYAEPGTESDYEPPYITDMHPLDENWPSGVPPRENNAGCHWKDDDEISNWGIDVDASEFCVYDDDMEPVPGTLMIDDGDLYDVVVVFEAEDLWFEGETYSVETTCYDLAGSSDTETWEFATGYTNFIESSLGSIKARFAER